MLISGLCRQPHFPVQTRMIPHHVLRSCRLLRNYGSSSLYLKGPPVSCHFTRTQTLFAKNSFSPTLLLKVTYSSSSVCFSSGLSPPSDLSAASTKYSQSSHLLRYDFCISNENCHLRFSTTNGISPSSVLLSNDRLCRSPSALLSSSSALLSSSSALLSSSSGFLSSSSGLLSSSSALLSSSSSALLSSSSGLLSSSSALLSCNQRRGFGSGDLKLVAARMKSVKSIQKITKAMKMVAASKLKADQRRLDIGMPFALPVQSLFSLLPQKVTPGDVSLLCLTSDKGLCGGVNSSVTKLARQTISQCSANGDAVAVYGVGDKIRSGLQRLFAEKFARIFGEVTKVPWSFSSACLIAERLIQAQPFRILILHNHFVSAISYDTRSIKLLSEAQAKTVDQRELDQFEFEPERKDVWRDLHEFYFACSIFGCLLDNIAAEQSARMSAMDNASKNAGEMLGNLTLKYNKARQAKITMELIEIISGANAL